MIRVETVGKETYQRYGAYVACHPKRRFGHDLAWARALRETYGVGIEHLVALDGEDVVGACPLFLCRPLFGEAHYQTSLFPSYFGPLYDSEKVLDAILEVICRKASAVQNAEIVAPGPLPADPRLPYLEQLDITYRLSLDNTAEHIFGNFRRNYRRILRDTRFPAEVEIVVDEDGALVADFYRLYAGLYARKHGFIPHTRRLFEKIYANYPKGAVRTYMARQQGKYIGGIFTIWEYGEIYCGWSAQDVRSEFEPMHFLIWKIIQDGVAQGLHWFNHGEAPREHESLRLFKQGWGMEESDTYRYFIPGKLSKPNVRLYDRYSWTKKVISSLPAPITSTVVSPLIRYFL